MPLACAAASPIALVAAFASRRRKFAHAAAAAIYPKLGYHPTRDFIPITEIAHFPLILAGAMADKIKTVKDAMAGLKVKPENTVVVGFSQGGGVAFDGGSCQTPDVKALV